ncbi:NUMOD4 domain-containing protein [Clostridium perfringens]|uniref:NUMOD4 domain-containing protein n=1 Tax=Clostridium perfringens TaxID=1502 RepID=UPI0018E44567|nr:NUMOD4 domain-containing protein [Clostridium perfringens]ELC8411524.1 HNH endonuclease [Clostridium perfringens]MBI6054504.1 HNH endonuclease [Clostridium perfringens]
MVAEEWRDIKGYEGLYQVSNYGRIKSLLGWNGKRYVKRTKILAPSSQQLNINYCRSVVKLSKNGERKDYKVHRLVAKAFLDNPNNYDVVNHKDGNPLNNNVENLEWCTQKQNIRHALENELKVSRIKTIDRETMVSLLNNNFSYDEISKMLGVAKGTVFNYIKKFNIKKIYI